MKIYFDFELKEELRDGRDENNIFHSTVKEFVNDRYKVLDDEVRLLETETDPLFIVLQTHDNGLTVFPINFTVELLEKAKDLLSDSDILYLKDLVQRKVNDEIQKN